MKRLTNLALIIALGLTGCSGADNKVNSRTDSQVNVSKTDTEQVNTPPFETWQVKEGSVYDGDTFRVVRGNEEVKIRFACIDAPEKDQPGGIESRDYLRSLLAQSGNQVKVNATDTDRYGRTVAELWIEQGSDWELVQLSQVEDGWVWANEKYKSDCPSWNAIAAAENQAQAGQRGIWSGNPQPPWEWRKANK